jgi:hypothetical protein
VPSGGSLEALRIFKICKEIQALCLSEKDYTSTIHEMGREWLLFLGAEPNTLYYQKLDLGISLV